MLVNGCKKNLDVLDQVLTICNALSDEERGGRGLWQKIPTVREWQIDGSGGMKGQID